MANETADQALRDPAVWGRLVLDSATAYALVVLQADGRIAAWNQGAEALLGWDEAEVLGEPVEMLFSREAVERGAPEALLQHVRTAGSKVERGWFMRKDGSRFWGEGTLSPLRDGKIEGFLKVLRDASGEHRSEERRRLLLGELQHRVRNILAVVRSMVSNTAETAADVGEFASHLDGRLAALGRTQNIFARTGEVMLNLEEAVRDEFASVGADEDQVEIDGPLILLRHAAAEPLAMALHELVTNAVKYGALACPNGRIQVRWLITEITERPILHFEWLESGVVAVDMTPRRTGFGRALIEKGLPFELGATTSIHFQPGGVRVLMRVPLTRDEVQRDGGKE